LKVLLINPPVRQRSVPQDIPYGLGIIATITENEGHQISFLDLNANRVPLQTAANEIAIDDYDVIGIGGLSSMYKDIRKLLPLCRQIHPDALIVAGGGFVTYMPDKMLTLSPEIDIVVIGEGEETWKEILKEQKSRNFSKIKGIAYRDESGNIIYTEPRPLIPDMDSIPYPAYHLMDLSIYGENMQLVNSVEAMTAKRKIHIVTERGCPRQCTFCTHNGLSRWDQLVAIGKDGVKKLDDDFGFQQIARFNSAKYVVNHMKFLYEKFGITYIFIADENLTSNRKRTHELCDLIINEGLNKKLHWGASGDTASVTDELVKHMKEAGCTYITFGGESGSDRVLKNDIQKGTTSKDNQNSVNIMKRQNMEPIMTFMVGNPNENIDDILETVEFFIKNNLTAGPFICTPYPGTRLYLDYENSVLAQFDEKLNVVKDLPSDVIDEKIIKDWKMKALEKFLISLDDADVLSAHVSQIFNHADLLGIQSLMTNKDMTRLLKLAHLRNWSHDDKWKKYCPVCSAKEELTQLIRSC
jgi:anaerobic magnesium-protoporphyrin IX monomethyl ester cyclase